MTGEPPCLGALECPPDREACACGWIETCLNELRDKLLATYNDEFDYNES